MDVNNFFDRIMLEIGDSGRFQKVYNFIFNFLFVIISTIIGFGSVITLAIPEHWCHVAGGNNNITLEDWKNFTIPRNQETFQYSECTMFNESRHETNCLNGWDFDQTYYRETIATQEKWFCDEEISATNFLVFGKIGDIGGTLLVQFGDVYGRRPIFLVSLVVFIISKLSLLFATGSYWAFMFLSVLGSLPSSALYQSPLVIATEISSINGRTIVPLVQSVAFTIGISIGPLIFWVFNHWVTFTLLTTIPLVPFLFLQPFMIESPRWLASKNKPQQCLQQLKKIAKLNGTKISDEIKANLNEKVETQSTETYSVITLFSNWRLAKKTILVIIGWTCYIFIYVILFLNIPNLKGNPFINYFWQGLAELPGYFVGKYFSDRIGRNITKSLSFTATSFVAFAMSYILVTSENLIWISLCGITLKFLSSLIFYTINLQTLEIYPTCLRQTGLSVGFLAAGIFGIFTPYVIYMGVSINKSIPYVVSGILGIVGGITGLFLPETLNQKLPETVSEAETFGENQKFFTLPKNVVAQ